MKKQQIKDLLKEQLLNMLNEDVNYNFNVKGKRFKVRFDVNANPTKKGVKIQFTPVDNLAAHPQDAKQIFNEIQVLLNAKLAPVGMTVDFDPDVPFQNVVGFTLKLGTLSNMIITLLQGDKSAQANVPDATVKPTAAPATGVPSPAVSAKPPLHLKENKNGKNKIKKSK